MLSVGENRAACVKSLFFPSTFATLPFCFGARRRNAPDVQFL